MKIAKTKTIIARAGKNTNDPISIFPLSLAKPFAFVLNGSLSSLGYFFVDGVSLSRVGLNRSKTYQLITRHKIKKINILVSVSIQFTRSLCSCQS